MLRGRQPELDSLRQLLAQARDRRGGAVVIRGEAGAGKTELLTELAAAAGPAVVLRCAGVESEAALPYAGLQVLLRGALGPADRLPARQRHALRGAVDLADAPAGDRFLVGAAVIGLLGELAEEQPVVVLVDDAQWLDQETADTLLFAARRLGVGRVAMVFAARDGAAGPAAVFGGGCLPELRLGPLDPEAGAALLADHAPGLHTAVAGRLLALAQGNPLALVELVGALTAAQRDGSEPVDDREIAVMPASWRVQRIFDERVRALPAPTRALLTVAAADDTGDVALVLAAARRLGAAAADLEPAETAALIRLTGHHLLFRHPLARAAAYQGAALTDRTAAHRALADALPAGGDVGRRAWHLAAATLGHDEQVAAELERSAELFRSRGGRSAVAAAYRRAAQLTADPDTRARRMAAAAAAASDAGQLEHAAALANSAGPGGRPENLARLATIRAGLEHGRGRPEAARLLLVEAAHEVTGRCPGVGARLFFEAATMAWDTPDPAGAAVDTLARVADLDFGASPLQHGATGLLGIATGDLTRGATALREFAGHVADTREQRSLADHVNLQGWDLLLGEYQGVYAQAVELEQECREQGAVGVLPRVLLRLARCRLFLGRHHDAHATAVEGLEIARDTGQRQFVAMLRGLLAMLAALDGDREGCHRPGDPDPALDVPPSPTWYAWAHGLLDLAEGRYEPALHRFAEVAGGPHRHIVVARHSLPDQIEAAARLGRTAEAAPVYEHFAHWSQAVRPPWARAVELRCRALLAPGDDAQALYDAALAAHHGDGRPFEQARTRLLYGEWLRRRRQRAAAREQLTTALLAFERMRARAWAERARGELRAVGAGPAPAPAGEGLAGRLTAQELQAVRLAATGMSNRDIGARLFISPRTVGYHLSNAYPKLGVTSRAALGGLDLGDG
ncbi:LuxR family transcriptional regulator [Kitasatospora sp. NPDC097643]|uniref:helix-turn-helix transcriptional regulator n=1 Tax=Kitasatospora sp. NPDC097643 TaxID=3157230 RepID=UPI0033177E94